MTPGTLAVFRSAGYYVEVRGSRLSPAVLGKRLRRHADRMHVSASAETTRHNTHSRSGTYWMAPKVFVLTIIPQYMEHRAKYNCNLPVGESTRQSFTQLTMLRSVSTSQCLHKEATTQPILKAREQAKSHDLRGELCRKPKTSAPSFFSPSFLLFFNHYTDQQNRIPIQNRRRPFCHFSKRQISRCRRRFFSIIFCLLLVQSTL